MDQRTQLATGQINGRDTITVELIKADETPAVVIIGWPSKASVIHPHRFPDMAATVAKLSAQAAT